MVDDRLCLSQSKPGRLAQPLDRLDGIALPQRMDHLVGKGLGAGGHDGEFIFDGPATLATRAPRGDAKKAGFIAGYTWRSLRFINFDQGSASEHWPRVSSAGPGTDRSSPPAIHTSAHSGATAESAFMLTK